MQVGRTHPSRPQSRQGFQMIWDVPTLKELEPPRMPSVLCLWLPTAAARSLFRMISKPGTWRWWNDIPVSTARSSMDLGPSNPFQPYMPLQLNLYLSKPPRFDTVWTLNTEESKRNFRLLCLARSVQIWRYGTHVSKEHTSLVKPAFLAFLLGKTKHINGNWGRNSMSPPHLSKKI